MKNLKYEIYYTTPTGGKFFQEEYEFDSNTVEEFTQDYVKRNYKAAKDMQYHWEIGGAFIDEVFMYVTVDALSEGNDMGAGGVIANYLDAAEDRI